MCSLCQRSCSWRTAARLLAACSAPPNGSASKRSLSTPRPVSRRQRRRSRALVCVCAGSCVSHAVARRPLRQARRNGRRGSVHRPCADEQGAQTRQRFSTSLLYCVVCVCVCVCVLFCLCYVWPVSESVRAFAQSYLVVDNVLKAIRDTGADCVHPGYGFLSENSKFSQSTKANESAPLSLFHFLLQMHAH